MDNNRDTIIDFILTELYKKPRYEGDSIDDIAYKFQKETGEKQDRQLWDNISRICEKDNLIERISNSLMHEITPKGINLMLEYGCYKNYKDSQNEYIRSLNENDNLIKKVNELSIVNLKLQNRQLKTKWIFSIIGFILGAIITHLKTILEFLKILPPQ